MMEVVAKWKEKMVFEAGARGLASLMDANSPIGSDTALNPKELVLAGLIGCTGMDVAALMKKHKQPMEALEVKVDAELDKTKVPAVFSRAHLIYSVRGSVEVEKVIEAVTLSKTKYCGVSAMLEKAFPITYEIQVNGEVVKDSRE